MMQKQTDPFTHPQQFVALCDEDSLETCIRLHGFKGTYEKETIPFIVSDRKIYRNKK